MELTIHSERHPLANRWRHVVAGDAEIRPHLPPLDTVEMQQRTVVVVVLLESATTCVHRRNILPCPRKKTIDRDPVPFLPLASNNEHETTELETTELDYVELRLLHFPIKERCETSGRFSQTGNMFGSDADLTGGLREIMRMKRHTSYINYRF